MKLDEPVHFWILAKKLTLLMLTIYLNVILIDDTNSIEEYLPDITGYEVILVEELVAQHKAVIFMMYYLTFAFEF